MKTFKELIDENKDLLKEVESYLVALFEDYYETDEIETLDYYNVGERLDYNGDLHNLIDGEVSIYYYDLEKWLSGNSKYIEEARDEGLLEGCEDIHKQIQAGQYIAFREYYNEQLQDLVDILNNITDKV